MLRKVRAGAPSGETSSSVVTRVYSLVDLPPVRGGVGVWSRVLEASEPQVERSTTRHQRSNPTIRNLALVMVRLRGIIKTVEPKHPVTNILITSHVIVVT